MNANLITEGSDLIADFMKLELSKGLLYDSRVYYKIPYLHDSLISSKDQFLYHISWDWLMPCIKKISSELSYDWYVDNIVNYFLDNNIERAFEISVDAIKTHNESVGGN